MNALRKKLENMIKIERITIIRMEQKCDVKSNSNGKNKIQK